jgi:alpha-ketoglutarate-dependent taurine dioxygenase
MSAQERHKNDIYIEQGLKASLFNSEISKKIVENLSNDEEIKLFKELINRLSYTKIQNAISNVVKKRCVER